MNRELYRETFSRLRASDQAKEELMNMTEEKKTGKVRTFKVVRNVLIAAALCLALIGTAFAAGVLEIDGQGRIVLGRFAYGEVHDTAGDVVAEPDPDKIASGEQVVVEPEKVAGAKLAEEDGRLILYYQYGPAEGREDVTDAMREEGVYSMSGEKDGYSLSVTVVLCPKEELENSAPLFYQGVGYCLEISGKFPGGNYISYDEEGNEVPITENESTFRAEGVSSFYANSYGLSDTLGG